jgi:trk system potassium uptake protein
VKTIIVGCGRVGSVLADAFDRLGHEVVVVDLKTTAFDRLPSTFRGAAVRGDGTDEDTLRRAGAEGADIFMAMTEGDNRNVMSAQLATEALGADRVIAKINDPVRASAYAELGIATLCRTNLMASSVNDFLGLGMTFGPGLSPATGHHPGGEHHDEDGPSGAADSGAASNGAPSAQSSVGEPAGSAPSSSSGNPSAQAAPVIAREG